MDVTNKFLNAILEGSIFVLPPTGYEYFLPTGHLIRFRKASKRLKQVPRGWNATPDTFLRYFAGMKEGSTDRCLHTRTKNGKIEVTIMIFDDEITNEEHGDSQVEFGN